MKPYADRSTRGITWLTRISARRAEIMLLIAIAGAAAGIWGCSDAGAPVTITPGTPDIQPLAVGNSWSFMDTTFAASISTEAVTMSVSAATTSTFAGVKRDLFVWDEIANGRLRERNLVRNESDGLWLYGKIDGPTNDTLLFRTMWARHPVSRGEGFSEDRYSFDPIGGTFIKTATWQWTCLSTSQQIAVGGGVTKPGIVFWTQPDSVSEERIFYIPGIGYAGWESRRQNVVTFRETLVDYSLK